MSDELALRDPKKKRMGRRDKQPINEWITVERVCELAQ